MLSSGALTDCFSSIGICLGPYKLLGLSINLLAPCHNSRVSDRNSFTYSGLVQASQAHDGAYLDIPQALKLLTSCRLPIKELIMLLVPQ
jgi:hypothetical protein